MCFAKRQAEMFKGTFSESNGRHTIDVHVRTALPISACPSVLALAKEMDERHISLAVGMTDDKVYVDFHASMENASSSLVDAVFHCLDTLLSFREIKIVTIPVSESERKLAFVKGDLS